MGMSTAKDELHELINALPDSELPAVKKYLQAVNEDVIDPVLRAIRNAPYDDEPETPEEAVAVEEAREAMKRGDFVSDDELRRELGL